MLLVENLKFVLKYSTQLHEHWRTQVLTPQYLVITGVAVAQPCVNSHYIGLVNGNLHFDPPPVMPIPITCVLVVSAFVWHPLPVSIDKDKCTPVISLHFISALGLLTIQGCQHLKMPNKSNLAFSKVVWQWKFGFVSLAFLAVFPYFSSSILDLAVTLQTGIILPPGSIHYQHLWHFDKFHFLCSHTNFDLHTSLICKL